MKRVVVYFHKYNNKVLSQKNEAGKFIYTIHLTQFDTNTHTRMHTHTFYMLSNNLIDWWRSLIKLANFDLQYAHRHKQTHNTTQSNKIHKQKLFDCWASSKLSHTVVFGMIMMMTMVLSIGNSNQMVINRFVLFITFRKYTNAFIVNRICYIILSFWN